jgi:sugar phosphate isomerase/epimerase
MLAAHNFRLAYENWCWATHAPTWKSVWNIVKAVNRPNVGLCLDTFQTAGSEWADPTTKSGMIESTDFSQTYIEERFQQSMKELAETVPAEKIYLLQISDGYKPAKPIENKVDDSGLRPRGQWSHDFRPYPFNGGYLPVVDVTRAVLKTGARCWFSMEVFDGGRHGQGGMKYDFEEFTQGAMDSMRKLLDECAKVEAPSGVQTPVAQ